MPDSNRKRRRAYPSTSRLLSQSCDADCACGCDLDPVQSKSVAFAEASGCPLFCCSCMWNRKRCVQPRGSGLTSGSLHPWMQADLEDHAHLRVACVFISSGLNSDELHLKHSTHMVVSMHEISVRLVRFPGSSFLWKLLNITLCDRVCSHNHQILGNFGFLAPV